MQALILSPLLNSVMHSTIAMIAVINPVICGVMIMQLGRGQSKKETIASSIKTMLIVLSILIAAAIAGKSILTAFGVSLSAFRVVGGIILSVIGFQLLSGIKSKKDSSDDTNDFTSLIMFAASPGTITMVITLSTVHNAVGLPISAIIGTALAVAITITVMIGMIIMAKKDKESKSNYFSKFMGLIIVSMGLQFILDGIKLFFEL